MELIKLFLQLEARGVKLYLTPEGEAKLAQLLDEVSRSLAVGQGVGVHAG